MALTPPPADSSENVRLEQALQESQTRYATLLGSVSAAFCVLEAIVDATPADYRVIDVNAAFAVHTGLKNARGRTIRELVPNIEADWLELFAAVERSLAVTPFDRPVGALEHRWFEGSAFPIDDPRLHRVALFFNNVNSKRRIELQLKQLNASLEKSLAESALLAEALYDEKERAQVTLNSIGDAVICTDIQGRVTYLNVAAEHLTGWTKTAAIGRWLDEVLHIIEAESRAEIPNPMALATSENKVVKLPPQCILVRRDATELAVEDCAAPIHDRRGQVAGAVMVFRDVSAARSLSAKLSHQAAHDALTDLPNRSLLNDRLAQAIASVHRRRTSLTLLYLDLDRFKHINDSLGHAIGDQLLKSVARRLTEGVRTSDTVSRQGGDEFVVMLMDIDTAEDAAHCAEKLLQSLRLPHLLGGHELHVSASIGISSCPQDGTDGETLLKNADSAMYEAKERGRNHYQFYRKDLNASAGARQALESTLRHALQRRELTLNYQPIMDVASGAIAGVEALVRWRHPQQGVVLPAHFMAIAEESGLIVPIGRWVLREACAQAMAWRLAGLPPLRLAVNISAVELRSKEFAAGVATTLQQTGLKPGLLELELTETFLMQDSKSTAVVLSSLKGLGVHLALDDFGTGYSSLSYMRRFPIDTLKIDRSFVSASTTDTNDASVVTAVINMGRSLKMRVIAEGVETREQLAFLQNHDCPEAQGYFFSHPVAADQFATLMRQGVGSTPGV